MQTQHLTRRSIVTPAVLQMIAYPIAHAILRALCRLRIEGAANLRSVTKGTYILAANHAHDLDPVLLRAAMSWLGTPLFFVARARQDYQWKGWRALVYGDAFFRAWGAYPARKGTKDYAESLQAFVPILQAGYPVAIFPAGMQRPPDYAVRRVRGGVGYLAATTGTPVFPVAIEGTQGLTFLGLLLRRHTITVHIGEPIPVEQKQCPAVEESREVAQRIWESVLAQQQLPAVSSEHAGRVNNP